MIDKIKKALLIRRVEETLLELYSKGKINGTIHTCVGQEFSAIAFAGQINQSDFVFSNHRSHGHYISFTNDYYGLLAELIGKKSGICGGIGGGQHIHDKNFYSNGIQGGMVPLAAGMALANKIENNDNIVIAFIGDGTLGEGILYETLNLISLWQIPLLIVCENNFYAQSTHIKDGISGNILDRAKAFSIKTFENDTWNIENLLESAKKSIDFVRKNKSPVFHLVNTYRLNAHSKHDDHRDVEEIKEYMEKDFLFQYSKTHPILYKEYLDNINNTIDTSIKQILTEDDLCINEYLDLKPIENKDKKWSEITEIRERQVDLINKFFHKVLKDNPKSIFIGEDVLSPYGGAFKVAKGLSKKYPNQVFTTPISEAAITGIANGLALSGYKPYVEIMFGDFIILALDQIINHASKVHHMYNHKVNCPIVIRTPMGGKRGYGATHSQTLDKFLIGIDNIKTIALNTYIDPEIIYTQISKETDPVIVIENKIDYWKFIGNIKKYNYDFMISNDDYPVIKVCPFDIPANLTIVTYGGMANEIMDCISNLHNFKIEVIILSKINPIDYEDILESVKITKRLVVIEEGSPVGGISSEIISNVVEKLPFYIECLKIGALPVPIPAVKSLENIVLPCGKNIIDVINKRFC
jgi:2-oxoisovalerate dehydrogenase E1 component